MADQRSSKRPTETTQSIKYSIKKRPKASPTLDLAVPFPIQPKIKRSLIPIGISAVNEPKVVLSMATAITLPLDKAMFHAKLDIVSITIATQSTVLAVEQIAEIGHRHHDAIELFNQLKVKVVTKQGEAKSAAAELAIVMQKAKAEAKRGNEEN
ncbi:hypothetical protein CsSME_00011460 [Camellia sinensis var. sinensis]